MSGVSGGSGGLGVGWVRTVLMTLPELLTMVIDSWRPGAMVTVA